MALFTPHIKNESLVIRSRADGSQHRCECGRHIENASSSDSSDHMEVVRQHSLSNMYVNVSWATPKDCLLSLRPPCEWKHILTRTPAVSHKSHSNRKYGLLWMEHTWNRLSDFHLGQKNRTWMINGATSSSSFNFRQTRHGKCIAASCRLKTTTRLDFWRQKWCTCLFACSAEKWVPITMLMPGVYRAKSQCLLWVPAAMWRHWTTHSTKMSSCSPTRLVMAWERRSDAGKCHYMEFM